VTTLLERIELSRAALAQGDVEEAERLAREGCFGDPASATAGLPAEELERVRRALAALLAVAEERKGSLGAALGLVATARRAASTYGAPPLR
jgi:hypothetical protein